MLWGTSRDPFLILDLDRAEEPSLVPYYEQIRQFGLDAQLTAGSWLFKLEAIRPNRRPKPPSVWKRTTRLPPLAANIRSIPYRARLWI